MHIYKSREEYLLKKFGKAECEEEYKEFLKGQIPICCNCGQELKGYGSIAIVRKSEHAITNDYFSVWGTKRHKMKICPNCDRHNEGDNFHYIPPRAEKQKASIPRFQIHSIPKEKWGNKIASN